MVEYIKNGREGETKEQLISCVMKNWTDQPKLRCFYSASEQTVTIYRMEFKLTLIARARGPFLESPGNFSGPKSNIQIEI